MYAFASGGGTPSPTIHSAQYGDESIGCKLICSPQDMVCNNNTIICALCSTNALILVLKMGMVPIF